MSDAENKTESEKTKTKKTKETKVAGLKANSMDMTLVNSAGQIITAKGNCSDIEIKAICRAIIRKGGSTIEIT